MTCRTRGEHRGYTNILQQSAEMFAHRNIWGHSVITDYTQGPSSRGNSKYKGLIKRVMYICTRNHSNSIIAFHGHSIFKSSHWCDVTWASLWIQSLAIRWFDSLFGLTVKKISTLALPGALSVLRKCFYIMTLSWTMSNTSGFASSWLSM